MDRVQAYADALFVIADAEGDGAETSDELFRFARVLESNDELRQTLADPHLPAARRQQITEDLLEGKATATTGALVSMVVGAGRSKDLPAIIDLMVDRTAREANREVAEVRSAVELTADQRHRLAAALESATGKKINLKVVVDESVLGGVVAQIGDTVIDGTVRHRLTQLRDSFAN